MSPLLRMDQAEIAATAPGGFDDAKIRTVKENGTTLKFQDNEFYAG